VIGAFKEIIKPFELKVLANNFILSQTNIKEYKNQIPIILPISFINNGYGEGIIESVILDIADQHKNHKIYQPKGEISFEDYYKVNQKISSENILGLYNVMLPKIRTGI
jgi:hypothetical protein